MREPNKRAIIISEKFCISYRELDDLSTLIAQTLIDNGLFPNSENPVGIMCNGHYAVAAILAVMKTGNPYVPLDPTYPKRRIEFMGKDSKLSFVLVENSTKAIIDTNDEDKKETSTIKLQRVGRNDIINVEVVMKKYLYSKELGVNERKSEISTMSISNTIVKDTALAYILYTLGQLDY